MVDKMKLDPEEVAQALGFEEFMQTLSKSPEFEGILGKIKEAILPINQMVEKLDQILKNQASLVGGMNKNFKNIAKVLNKK
ncbi:hypothetical protein [Candidatus Lokiarchaeum ossiferum]|uniref:hypothetical protein n=1 Tax=Candidatus Lokiarchaeum ossiferum TaxID=2951803 RepID=UPI00352FC2D5